jgi:HTH-type transcriptional regulator, competence development regulator
VGYNSLYFFDFYSTFIENMGSNRYDIEIENFGKRLREIRTKQKLSQLDLEIKSGINRTEISKIENGLKNIEFFTIVKLAEALEVEMNELFKRAKTN